MYCGNCGAEVNGTFCPRCGARQDTGYAAPPQMYHVQPVKTDAKKKQALVISLIVSLLATFLLGLIVGGIVMVIIVVLYALTKTERDEDPILYALIGGVFGVMFGAVLTVLFLASLFF